MQALSSLDASWFYGESERMPFHVANLHLFDKPTGRKVDLLEALRTQVAERLPLLPLLHRKLDLRSLKLGQPVWVNVTDIDHNYHLQRATLDAPGSREQLNDMVVKLHRPLLDRKHPLWQIFLIEGLADGGFGLYMKLHHGGVDGGSASMVVDGLFAEEGKPQGEASGAPLAEEARPGVMQMLWHSALNFYVNTPIKVAGAVRGMAKSSVAAAKPGEAKFNLRDMMQLVKPAPKTPFNKGLTAERSWGSTSLPLSEVKALGKQHDGTINDVVLAVITGALRRYLEKSGKVPNQPLVAGIPVSVREPGNTSHNNQVSIMTARLPVNEPDPNAWMPIVRKSVQAAKKLTEAVRPMSRMQVELPTVRMPFFNNLGSMLEALKAAESVRMHDRLPPFVNLWVSNVPGPRTPLMFAGHAARTFNPVALVMHGAALNVTVISYLDRMDFGVLACPNAVPDAQEVADLLAAEFQTLKTALH